MTKRVSTWCIFSSGAVNFTGSETFHVITYGAHTGTGGLDGRGIGEIGWKTISWVRNERKYIILTQLTQDAILLTNMTVLNFCTSELNCFNSYLKLR